MNYSGNDDALAGRPEPAPVESTSSPTVDRESSSFGQVLETLLRRHMDQVEDELELMKARLAGVHRVLDQIERDPWLPADYRLWELGLQRVEAAYVAVAAHARELAGLVEWEQIGQVLERLHRLARHVQDDMAWLDSPLFESWEARLRHLGASSAAVIADLALQLAAHLEPAASAGPAVRQLEAAARDVVSSPELSSARSAPAATDQRLVSRPALSRMTGPPAQNEPVAADGQPAAVPTKASLPGQALRDSATPPRRPVPPPSAPDPASQRPRQTR